MSKSAKETIKAIQKDKGGYYGSKILFQGDFPEYDSDNWWVWNMIFELINNSGQKGAKRIEVRKEGNQLKVNDDVIEVDPAAKISLINEIISSGLPRRIHGLAGAGLFTIKRSLDEHRGKIVYQAKEGRIVVTANWE